MHFLGKEAKTVKNEGGSLKDSIGEGFIIYAARAKPGRRLCSSGLGSGQGICG